jgi:hypothetical protein
MNNDDLVTVTNVQTEIEGRILCDLLQSGGIAAMYHSLQAPGYGALSVSFTGSAGEVLVHRRDLAEAQRFVELWRVPLLEESDAPTSE